MVAVDDLKDVREKRPMPAWVRDTGKKHSHDFADLIVDTLCGVFKA